MGQNRSTGNSENDGFSREEYRAPASPTPRPQRTQQPSLRQMMRTGAPSVRMWADEERARRQSRAQAEQQTPGEPRQAQAQDGRQQQGYPARPRFQDSRQGQDQARQPQGQSRQQRQAQASQRLQQPSSRARQDAPSRMPSQDDQQGQQPRQQAPSRSRQASSQQRSRTGRQLGSTEQGPTRRTSTRGTGLPRERSYRTPAMQPATQGFFGLPRWLPVALLVVLIGAGVAMAAGRCSSSSEPPADAPAQASQVDQQGAASSAGAQAGASSTPATDAAQAAVQAPTFAASNGILDYAIKTVAYRATTGPMGDWSISFASTGDMIFGRQVGDFVDMYGGAATLERVSDQLAAADVTIGNVEAPLSNDESEAKWAKDVIILSRPEGIDALKLADFTFVSLANNHSMDYGGPALADTIAALDEAGIKHAGAGMNYDEAWQLAETTIDGVRIAFLSFTDVIPEDFLAYETSPGVAGARIDMDETCKAVSDAAKNHDIVVVAMHWGIEYEDYITEYMQSEPAHQLVDAGADIILGNHPHVIQGIEFYKGALISYSQGDFVFDHFSTRKTGETFILDFDMTAQGVKNVRATPIYLEDPCGIPYVLEGQEAADILERLELISEGMNTTFEMHDDIATITATDGVNRHQR